MNTAMARRLALRLASGDRVIWWPSREVLREMANMDWDDYLRDEAGKYRQLAEKAETVFDKQEFLGLAVVCEEVANSIEDRLTGG